jgi:hypothetical protein
MDKGPFLGLVEEEMIPDIVHGIETAVLLSVHQDRVRNVIIVPGSITKDELKRRSAMCIEIFRVLRGDLKWSLDRIADNLADFLRKQLDGVDWEPAARASWTAPAN